MSDETVNLALPYILSAQAQKHVTHNEALRRLDGLIQLVLQSETATPPGAPAAPICRPSRSSARSSGSSGR